MRVRSIVINAASPPPTIARSTGRCAATGQPIDPGQPRFVVLVESPCDDPAGPAAEPLARLDFSLDAWARGDRPKPPARIFAAWRSAASHEDPGRRPIVREQDALDLLIDLCESQPDQPHPDAQPDAAPGAHLELAPDPSADAHDTADALRLVLALLLVRRRKLRLVEDARSWLTVRVMAKDHPAYDQVLHVPAPLLGPQDVDRIACRLEKGLALPAASGAGPQEAQP